jgi:hypothetical protein
MVIGAENKFAEQLRKLFGEFDAKVLAGRLKNRSVSLTLRKRKRR